MRLEAFRVRNFKKVRDSGWVSCQDLTVFVGKNEAGKSALFRGLSKLNPSDGERYDSLKEFPRQRYTAEFASQDWPVATGRFVLEEEGRKALSQLCPLLPSPVKVEVTRHYSWRFTIEFDPAPESTEQAEVQEQLATAKQWVAEHLPTFIYFDRYDVIESAIHIPSFVQQVATNQSGPRVRVTQCLFKHAGLDVEKLVGLGSHQVSRAADDLSVRRQVDERAILVSLASNAMTQQFGEWWDQRKQKFRYQLDGDYFRIWVSDDLDPSDIELDQRSAGMQYFFSFFTVFLAEAQRAHANNILLLDEPGLHIHGAAQAKVVQLLEKLSHGHQTLYSTHSPFMVDATHLENARAVYEGEDGTTKVSEDVWPRDRESLFPLQAALSYQVTQELFYAKRQVIVESITDWWLLKALDQAIAARGKTQLLPDIEIVPASGLAKMLPLASMLMSNKVDIAVLLSGHEPARQQGKKIIEKLLAGDDRKCLFIGDFTNNKNAQIEDIFPETEYLSAVKKAYPGTDLTFSVEEKALPRIVQRVENLFERKGLGYFERWKVAIFLRDRILEAPRIAPLPVVDTVSRIFEAMNSLFPASHAKGTELR